MKSSQVLYGRREQRKSAPLSNDIFIRPGRRKSLEPLGLDNGVQAGLDAAVDRQEFADADDGRDRNPNEFPEQAYRRGYQQGAHAVLEPLIKAKLLDERTETEKLRLLAGL